MPKLAKRPAAASTPSAAKKPKRSKYDSDLVSKCGIISAALKDAPGLPENVQTMLSSCVLECLAQPKDVRHSYQEQVAEWIYEALASTEKALSADLSEMKTKHEALTGDKTNRENAVSNAELELTKCKDAVLDTEVKASEAEAALKTAITAVQDANTTLTNVEDQGSRLLAEKLELEQVLAADGEYTKWKIEQANKKSVDAFIKSLNSKMFEQALLKAIALVLIKEPSTRTDFDQMVIKQFEETIQKKGADLSTEIEGTAPKKEECQAAIKDADSQQEKAQGHADAQRQSAQQAVDSSKAAELALKEARKSLRELGPEIKEVAGKSSAAESSLTAFKGGALASFTELRDRTTPVEEPVPSEEPEAPAEPEQLENPTIPTVEETAA